MNLIWSHDFFFFFKQFISFERQSKQFSPEMFLLGARTSIQGSHMGDLTHVSSGLLLIYLQFSLPAYVKRLSVLKLLVHIPGHPGLHFLH